MTSLEDKSEDVLALNVFRRPDPIWTISQETAGKLLRSGTDLRLIALLHRRRPA